MALVTQVARPERRARSGGIKSIVGEFTPVERLGASDEIGWEGADCGDVKSTFVACFTDEENIPNKTFDGVEQISGISAPFARYAGVSCFIGGDSDESYLEQARRLLLAREDRAVETVLWGWAKAAPTPGTAANLTEAIGKAEQFADADYVGLPVLVMSRQDATAAAAAGALKNEDGKLVSPNGVPVLATGVIPDADLGTVAVIGWPGVYATAVTVAQAPQLSTNVDKAIAERVYAVGIDCEFRYAVKVTTP